MMELAIVGLGCFAVVWVLCAILASGKVEAAYMDGFTDCCEMAERGESPELFDCGKSAKPRQ